MIIRYISIASVVVIVVVVVVVVVQERDNNVIGSSYSFIYILSGFNVVLALIIIFNFTDFQLPLFYLLLDTLNLMLPVIIIDAINEYIIDLGLFFKNTLS